MPAALVVDDNKQIRDILAMTLSAAGFTVARARDGVGAVERAHCVWPDLVVLDFSVSEKGDAWEIWDALAAVDAGRPLRVILYSAEITEVEKARAYARGAAAVVDKTVIGGWPIAMAIRDALAGAAPPDG